MKKLTTIQILLVRACKSQNKYNRLIRLYKMFYGDYPQKDQALANILSHIVDEFCPISTLALMEKLHPTNHWKCGVEDGASHYRIVVAVLASHIGLTAVEKFPGWRSGAHFRRLKEAEAV